jgi:hypothetical protein
MIPERQCVPVDCQGQVKEGTNISVFKAGADCQYQLTGKMRVRGGAIPVQLTENKVELRDGSVDYPIVLPNLQKSNAAFVAEILIRLPDGTIAAWDLGNFLGEKKLTLVDGQATFNNDYSSHLFSGEICEEDCSGVESALGVKRIVKVCVGQPDTIMYQICRIPVGCSTDEAAQTCDPLTSISGQ